MLICIFAVRIEVNVMVVVNFVFYLRADLRSHRGDLLPLPKSTQSRGNWRRRREEDMTVKQTQPGTSRPVYTRFRMSPARNAGLGFLDAHRSIAARNLMELARQACKRPSAENLIPIRIDVEFENRRVKDAFTWNADDPDTEIYPFVRRLTKDLNISAGFTPLIGQAMQAQIAEFRSFEAQEMSTEERVQTLRLDLRVNNTVIHDQFLWDVNNFSSDPEGFAKGLCKDLELEDPEVPPAIAMSIREQLYEIAKQNIASGRETRISKKARRDRGSEFIPTSTAGTFAVNLMRRPNSKISIVRRRNEWDLFEPHIEILSDKEAGALDAREERNARQEVGATSRWKTTFEVISHTKSLRELHPTTPLGKGRKLRKKAMQRGRKEGKENKQQSVSGRNVSLAFKPMLAKIDETESMQTMVEERRMKKRQEEKEDGYSSRYNRS